MSDYVPTKPLPPGVAEMLADERHFKRREMQVVDYSQFPPPPDEDLLPSLVAPPKAPAPGYWGRLWAALWGRA